ncbi:hypothetical protein PV11_06937 [Exophiala sideris]|uniref:Uncharacterized protein n=1 Tax=Exophiala sideris TaxID=1016849 RepID=A0A0D1YEV9_9EURO|nr:hypothetical protein PV11_06937 [Exophiala sideris]
MAPITAETTLVLVTGARTESDSPSQNNSQPSTRITMSLWLAGIPKPLRNLWLSFQVKELPSSPSSLM